MYVGTGKLALKYGLTKHIVRKLAEQGLIEAILTTGGHYKVLEISLQSYLEGNK